jgi:hypothetical protein
LALAAAGCWTAALELAPLGIRAAEAVGSGATTLAASSTGSHSGDHGEDEIDRGERCDELQDMTPNVIEFRKADPGGVAQWRELRLDTSASDPRWIPAGDSGAESVWHAAQNLPSMSLSTPIVALLKPGTPSYLAYAAAEPQTISEDDQLAGLTADFGAGVGTFQWNGRLYQYALANKLPCFPAPVATR